MKRLIWIIPTIAILALVVIKLVSNKKATQEKVYQYDKEQAISVETQKISLENIEAESTYTGTFEPNKEVKISAENQAKINRFHVDLGDHVKKGQSLIQLDNSLLQIQLEAVEVQIEGFEKDVVRYTALAKADAIQGIQLEKAELGLKAARVQKANLQEQINKTNIRAAFDGIITAKLSEVGAFAAPGIPLVQLTDISKLKFTIQIPENEVKHFKEGQNYRLKADALPEIQLLGHLKMIGSKANIGNSYPLEFEIENTEDLAIKSGMFGKVFLEAEQTEQAIIVPSSAILSEDGILKVYLIKDGKAYSQKVKVERNIADKSLITEGLSVGDEMVTKGFINLFEAANVKTKN